MSQRTLTALAVVALSAGLGACGGSKKALSHADLVKQADAICKTAQDSAKGVKPPTSFQDANAAAMYFDKIAPIADKETKDLQGLKASDKDSAAYGDLLSAQKSANDLLQTITKKADSKDTSGLNDLKKIQPAANKASAAAKRVGATACG